MTPAKPPSETGPTSETPSLAAALRAGRPLALLDEADIGWIDAMIDVVVRHASEPWRVALEEIEAGEWITAATRANATAPGRSRAPNRDPASERPHVGDHDARNAALSVRPHVGDHDARNAGTAAPRDPTPRRIKAAVAALRRLLGGRAYQASLARKARALVLGVPALDADARTARLSAAALLLGLPSREVELVLWADLPSERPVELVQGRPAAAEVAAYANVGLVQRSLGRAHAVELRVRGDAGPLLRAVAARGLIATTSRAADGATVFEIAGPLALCHRTAVYGRALGGLVPLLGGCDDFEMQIRAEARGQTYELVVAAPALLPALPPPRPWKLVEKLARDLEKRGFTVARAPAPIATAHGIVCPDLGVELAGSERIAPVELARSERTARVEPAAPDGERATPRCVWLEIVGFWTPEFLARKLARYAAAGILDVVLCVDGERACDDDDPPPGACVVRFERRIDAGALAQLLGGAPA